MDLLKEHGKTLPIIMLLLQIIFPLYGSLYIFTVADLNESEHTGVIACAHTDADSDHEPGEKHQQVLHCHVLDAPYDTASRIVVKHSPLVSQLTASYKGALLPGYGVPFDIPPEDFIRS